MCSKGMPIPLHHRLIAATTLLATVAASSAAASPLARVQSRQKFLLYDVIFHEQLNKQRRALMFYLDLAMKLKRTLVLPRPRLLRRLPSPLRMSRS